MYPIVRKEVLADQIVLMDIKAPRVARKCLPGQFIIAKTDEVGERIPLTICDYNREEGTVTIVVQTIGAGTLRMMDLNEGDSLMDFVGPLGCASELCEEKNEVKFIYNDLLDKCKNNGYRQYPKIKVTN